MQFTQLPVPLATIFEQLQTNNQIMPIEGKVWQPLYPSWFDPKVYCAYHSGVLGHATNDCMAFRHAIHDLIDKGQLIFEPESISQEMKKHQNFGGWTIN